MIHHDRKRNPLCRHGFFFLFGVYGKNQKNRQKAGKKYKNMEAVNFKYHYNHPDTMYMITMGDFCLICSSISVDLEIELLYNIKKFFIYDFEVKI